MEKKTNEDEDDWTDVDAVMAALQDPSDAGLEALGEIVELDRFLSFWATEVAGRPLGRVYRRPQQLPLLPGAGRKVRVPSLGRG